MGGSVRVGGYSGIVLDVKWVGREDGIRYIVK